MNDQHWLPGMMRREAHESVKADKARMKTIVFTAIRRAGKRGLTTDEVEIETGMSHQTASARVNELRNAGSILASGVRPTRSGRRAVVYVASSASIT